MKKKFHLKRANTRDTVCGIKALHYFTYCINGVTCKKCLKIMEKEKGK